MIIIGANDYWIWHFHYRLFELLIVALLDSLHYLQLLTNIDICEELEELMMMVMIMIIIVIFIN